MGRILGLGLSVLVFLQVTLAQEPRLVITPAAPEYVASVGLDLTFTCKAEVPDASLITDIKWVNPEGQEITNGDRVYTEDYYDDDIPRRQLFFRAIQQSDSGNYTCRATYTSSQTLSASVTLSTRIPITWVNVPEEQHATLGGEYKVKCVVNANPAPVVSWLKDDVRISRKSKIMPHSRKDWKIVPDSPRDTPYVFETDGILISNVTRNDAGVFTCRASVESTGDFGERKITLKIIVPPTFTQTVSDIEAVEGGSARFDCTADGEPHPTYEFIDPQGLPVVDRPGFIINPNSGIMVIEEVKREHAGKYRCRATNGGGVITAEPTLHVITKPTIVSYVNVTGVQDADISIECIVRGDPLPEITFIKEGSDNIFSHGVNAKDTRVSVEAKPGSEAETAVARMTIYGSRRDDDGLYKCVGKNGAGLIERMGHITVEFRPNFDETPMKETWTWDQRPVNLTCRASSIPNATINWWNSRSNAIIDENGGRYKIYNGDGESTILINPVDDSFYGEYRCLAENKHGKAEHTITLKQAHVPQPPTQATFQTVTATTITFKFFGPQNTGGRELTSYAVQFRKQNEDWQAEAPNKEWPIDSPYILENLEPQTTYVFRFFARNPVGFSTYGAQTQYAMPKRAAPEKPKILATPTGGVVNSVYPQKYSIQWQIMPDNGMPIDQFQIIYYPVRQSNTGSFWTEAGPSQKREVTPGTVEHELKDLKPETNYKIEIRAHNAIGFSEPADIVIKTAKDPRQKKGNSSPTTTAPATLVAITTTGVTEASELAESHIATGSGIIAAVVVSLLLIILIIVDVTCCLMNRVGIFAAIHKATCGKSQAEKQSVEVGVNDKAPLQNEMEERETTPMMNGNGEKKIPLESSVESLADIKKSASKDSAV